VLKWSEKDRIRLRADIENLKKNVIFTADTTQEVKSRIFFQINFLTLKIQENLENFIKNWSKYGDKKFHKPEISLKSLESKIVIFHIVYPSYKI
jgi:hypothetical protein